VLIAARIRGPVDAVTVLLDGVAQEEALPAPYEYTWDTTQVPEGPHSVQVRAVRGDEVVLSESRVVTVDRTPPTLLTRLPEPGAQNVALSQRIEMTFSEPIAAETLSPESVRLMVGTQAQETKLDLSDDRKTLGITPTTKLEVPSSPSVELASTITDLAGNPLTIPSEAWSWNHPSMLFVSHYKLPSMVYPPFQIGLALDEFNHPIIASQDNGLTSTINQWTGTEWSPITDKLLLENPTMQRHSDGSIFVAGTARDTTRPVHIKRWSPTGWLTLEPALGPLTTSYHLSLSLTPQKKLGFAWIIDSAKAIEVRLRSSDDWAPLGPSLTANSGGGVYTPTLQLDDSGKHVVAWMQGDSIHVRQWDGQNWQTLGGSPNTRLPTHVFAKQPALALKTDGRPVVAWIGDDRTFKGIAVYVQEWDGLDWNLLGPPLRSNPPQTPAAPPQKPTLRLDPTGIPVVAWSEGNLEPLTFTTHIRRWDGANWVTIGDSRGVGRAQPGEYNFVLDAQGLAVLACLDFDRNDRSSWFYVLRQNQ